ncbi:MAG: NAD-dependent epimerase/dehydratase [Candidatus Babeliaceae bacterium]|nr:NAD-dependent epimerase/dehydratase [Candidatus Babeliaceae bacterium]
MKILIVGNLGYVGPGVVNQLRTSYPDAELIGFDIGYFAHCLTNTDFLPETKLNSQFFGDIRNFPEKLLVSVDAVINLAAISNDPIGNKFENVTMDINYKAAVRLAEMSKENGVKSFVYASSCSMYGQASDAPRSESDPLNPLTAYARSKVAAEKDLEKIASENFVVTCPRFATACGWSPRLRLDLVLNDFVAGALVNRHISILSDGTPWRPLINTKDMARALDWAVSRDFRNGGAFVAVNCGSDEWNTTMMGLAEATAEVIPGVDISVNQNAPPDKRSYRASFDLFKKLAPNHQPQETLKSTIAEMKSHLTAMQFNDGQYRDSQLMRLNVINRLIDNGFLNNDLKWNDL